MMYVGSRTPVLETKQHARFQNDEDVDGEQMVTSNLAFAAHMMDKTNGTRTFSKRTTLRHLAELNENDGVSMKSHNDTIVSALAILAMKKIKATPGITREQIIAEIDQRYPNQSQMRRTYDVLNILHTAEVLKIDNQKRYFYDPEVLEG